MQPNFTSAKSVNNQSDVNMESEHAQLVISAGNMRLAEFSLVTVVTYSLGLFSSPLTNKHEVLVIV